MAYSSAPSESDRVGRVIHVLAPLGYRLGTPWVRPTVRCAAQARSTSKRRRSRGTRGVLGGTRGVLRGVRGAGTLDQQEATVERVSKEIGALADLVEANEAKGRMGQVRASTAPGYARLTPARDYAGCCTHGVLTGMPWCPSMHVPAREWP
jgi:hypothetical protein